MGFPANGRNDVIKASKEVLFPLDELCKKRKQRDLRVSYFGRIAMSSFLLFICYLPPSPQFVTRWLRYFVLFLKAVNCIVE